MSPTSATEWAPADMDTEAAWNAYLRHHAASLTDEITLRNGEVVTVRAIRPDDVGRLQAFHARLSPETIVMRYFRAAPVLYTRDAKRLTHLDYEHRMALVATTGSGVEENIIGVVRYERVTATEGELAFVVEDRWQGLGISTKLLVRLLAYALVHGFTKMSAVTMANNVRMRDVLAHAGYPHTSRYDDGCLTITLDITQPPTERR